MKNKTKRLIALVGVFAVICVATIAVSKYEEHKEKIANSEEVILSIAETEAQSLSWEYANSAFAFHRDENGVWLYDEDTAFPVDSDKIAEFLAVFSEFSTAFKIEEVEDLGLYGLDTPVCTINLATAESTYTVQLGDYSKMDEQRYVSVGDGNVYLVTTDPLDTFNVTISEIIEHDTIPSVGQADSITFTADDGYTLTYKEDEGASYCAEDVYYIDDKPLDTSKVEAYLSSLCDLTLSNYRTYNATAEEIEEYGLTEPELTVEVNYTVTNDDESTISEQITLHIGLVTEEAEDEEEEPETAAYARVGESQIIYKLSESDKSALLAYTYDDLRHTDMFTADFSEVTSIAVTLEGVSYTFTKETDEEENEIWKYGEDEIEISSVKSSLNALEADSFTSADTDGQLEISLVLSLENAHADSMEIALYRYDGSLCLCQVGGETISLIPRGDVVDLIEAVNAIILN